MTCTLRLIAQRSLAGVAPVLIRQDGDLHGALCLLLCGGKVGPSGDALTSAVISSVSLFHRCPGQVFSSQRLCKWDSRQSKSRQGGVWSHRQSPPRQAAGQQWCQTPHLKARGECVAMLESPDVQFCDLVISLNFSNPPLDFYTTSQCILT